MAATVLASAASLSCLAQAQPLAVPNGSFESPVTSFVDLRIDAWQKYPKPAGFPVTDEQWEQGVGMFKNTAPGAADHIDNINGNQAIFIFNGPGAGVFLDYDAVDWSGQTHALTSTFEPGRSYTLSVALIGGGGNMPEGAELMLSLFYRAADNSMVTIAATPVLHSAASFPNTTHFVDFQVNLPTVKAADAWAGKHIGISIVSTGPFDKPGGYWDIDNVRLTAATPTLAVSNPSFESPVTTFVDLRIDAWQKYPVPPGFPVSPEEWEQGVGLFKNTAPSAADHIHNMDGDQAVYLFNAPGSGIFQDFNATDYAGQTHFLPAKFEVGASYNLTVGMLGGGGNLPEGATALINFYYRDAENKMVTITGAPVIHSTAVFPTTTRFVDFQASLPAVKTTDAWADKYIGVSILSAGPFDKPGGYWDLDNVRLTTGTPSTSVSATPIGGNVRLSWTSSAGYLYQLRTSSDLKTWTNLDAPMPGAGAPLTKVITPGGNTQAFFNVLVTPAP